MRQLSDQQFAGEWMRYHGASDGIRLMGWCLWMYAQGARSYGDIRGIVAGRRGDRGLARRASYENLRRLRLFREHYAALEERELVDDDEVIVAVVRAMRPEVAA